MSARARTLHRMPVTGVVGATALALTLAACSGAGGSNDAGSSASSSPQSATASCQGHKGGTLTVEAGGPVQNWDPGTNPNTIPGLTADRMNAIYGVLVYVDQHGDVQGQMAKSLTSTDNVTWTLKLRDGVKFTDGTAYDAAAVKANWDRIAAPGSGEVAQAFAATFTTEVSAPTTLTIKLQSADPTFAMRVAESLAFIASPQSLQQQGKTYAHPVGAGAFVLSAQDPGVSETLSRNPKYWDSSQPYLDTIVFKYVADPAQRVATVVQGGGDYMNGYPFQFSQQAQGPGVSTFKVPTGGIREFVFNNKTGPFTDVRAREAVELAIDPNELVQALTQDPTTKGSRSLFPTDSPYYDKSLTLPGPDLKKAQSLLDQLNAEKGGPLKFTILEAGVPELDRAAQYMQLSLQKLKGVQVDIQTVAIAGWRPRVNQGNYDLTFYPGIYDLNPAPIAMTQLFSSTGGENIAQFSDPAMETALAKARAATGNDRVAAMAQVQKIYVKDVPVVVFGIDYRTFFARDRVAGFTPMGRGSLLMKNLCVTKSS